MIPVDRIYEAARAALDVIVGYYDDEGVDLPEHCYVSEGLAAWDGDQLTVQVERTYRGLAGQPTRDTRTCLGVRSATMSIELVRCVPGHETRDGMVVSYPTPEQHDESARLILGDQAMVINALTESYRAGNLGGCKGLWIDDWESLGPNGNLAGGRLRIAWQLSEGV